MWLKKKEEKEQSEYREVHGEGKRILYRFEDEDSE